MLVDRTPKSNMTYYMVRVGFSKSPNYTKCQLSSAEAKNNCILEPPKPHFQFRFRSANSFGKITKMGSQKSHKIIQITLILARTSFLLNSRIFRFALIREGLTKFSFQTVRGIETDFDLVHFDNFYNLRHLAVRGETLTEAATTFSRLLESI